MYTIRDNNSISSYPDDNTPYILGDTPADVVNLGTCSVKQFGEFSNNQIKANSKKEIINEWLCDFPLICVCHGCFITYKNNRLHERCIRIVYSNKTPSFDELLYKDVLQALETDIFNIHGKTSCSITEEKVLVG